MNILFLTLSKVRDLKEENLYADLMNEFRIRIDSVYIVTPIERKEKRKSVHKIGKNYEILELPV